MKEAWAFLSGLDLSPLWISLKTGAAATVVSFFVGILLARFVTKQRGKGRTLIDSILTLPLVLPPTVAGFFLLRLFSLRGAVGQFLYTQCHVKIVQTWLGCVIAATVIALPLMYRNAKAAFLQVDETLIQAARTLGMSERTIFWRVRMPLARPGVLSGTILTFARAMGEYGATAMLAGNIPGKTATISQRIAMVIQDGDYATAGFWSAVVIVLALTILLVTGAVVKEKKYGP